MNVERFESFIATRKTVRRFQPTTVPVELLDRLCAISQRAPSAYNLQPTHYYITTQRQKKEALLAAAMGQQQVISAPVVIAFAGDMNVVASQSKKIFDMDQKQGSLTEKQIETYRLALEMNFSSKPLGFGKIAKAIFGPFLRLFTPLPELPVVHKRAWVYKQVSLTAMTFLLAAHSAGLATCLMEWFDERRVKKTLQIPRQCAVPLIVAVGYPDEDPTLKSRLPLNEVRHWV